MKKRNSVFEYLSMNRLPWIVMGVLFTMASLAPFFILREHSVITYHDQLDGELITYILNAKHLFDGANHYLELMDGINKNGVASPAPLFVLFFKWFKPFTAFMICMIIVKLTAFVSMFLLLDELVDMKLLSFVIAMMFMMLPFYAVYGLCIPGQPLVYYALLKLKNERLRWPFYLLFIIYGLCSSLALVGFAVLTVMFVAFIYSLITKGRPFRYALACLILGLTYLLENVSLVKQLMGFTDGFVSHKSEMVRNGIIFPSGLWNMLINGADYTKAYQIYFLPVITVAIVAGGFYLLLTAGSKGIFERTYKGVLTSTLAILVLASVSAFFDSKVFAKFANSRTGVLHDFSFDRFSWLLTVLWFVLLAYSIKMLLLMSKIAIHATFAQTLSIIFVIVASFTSIGFSFVNSDLKSNVMKLLKHGDYYMMTWQQFYAEDLFGEVDRLIGRDKKDYRVVSLGIYPAAAAYNGFYCLDAYSNNYDVNYKHSFRKVIAPQIEKSEYLTEWFDNWGNRCYITLYENMNYYAVEKKWGGYTENYELDFEQLKNLGCEYIISAEYLITPERYGLTLLNETPIETDESWYRLFIYEMD